MQMQSSRYTAGNRSHSSSQSLKPAKGFWQKLVRFFQTGWLNPRHLYRQSRKFLWIGTTGIILLVVPFAFSQFLEVSEELQQISKLGGQEMSRM